MEGTAATLTQITTRVDDEVLRRLDAYCDAERRSRSFVLGEALAQLLDREAEPQPVDSEVETPEHPVSVSGEVRS